MRVINTSNKTLKYQTKGQVIVLNPGVNEVSDELVTVSKLKACYGQRIKVFTEKELEDKVKEAYNAYSGNAKPAEPKPRTDNRNELESRMEAIYNVYSGNAKPVDPPVQEEYDVVNPEEEVKVEISDPEVDPVDPGTDPVQEEYDVVNPEEEIKVEISDPEVQKEDEQTPLVETEVKADKKASGKKKSTKKNK